MPARAPPRGPSSLRALTVASASPSRALTVTAQHHHRGFSFLFEKIIGLKCANCRLFKQSLLFLTPFVVCVCYEFAELMQIEARRLGITDQWFFKLFLITDIGSVQPVSGAESVLGRQSQWKGYKD
ncbi:hypothetical protein HN873_044094 [Arachis hypogaea]